MCDVKSRLQELFCRKNPLFSQWSPPTHAGGVIARYEAVGNVPAGNRRTTRERNPNLVATTVHEYNHERLHSALNYLTPADYRKGEDNIKQRLERRKDALEKASKDRRQRQALLRQETCSA